MPISITVEIRIVINFIKPVCYLKVIIVLFVHCLKSFTEWECLGDALMDIFQCYCCGGCRLNLEHVHDTVTLFEGVRMIHV